MSDRQVILYSFRRCPYAMRARMALHVAGIDLEHREILLKYKPAAMLDASPKGTVPVVIDPAGNVIDESLDVMIWALEQHDPQDWLEGRDEMMDLIATNDGPFKHHLDRYKYSVRYEDADPEDHRAEGLTFLETLNERLTRSHQLFGNQIRLADIAIFPFVRQFANADRTWFDSLGLNPLQRWLEGHLESELFASIMKKHDLWEDG